MCLCGLYLLENLDALCAVSRVQFSDVILSHVYWAYTYEITDSQLEESFLRWTEAGGSAAKKVKAALLL